MQAFGMRFLDLLERSVIVQGLVTVGFVGTAMVLYVRGQEVPQALQSMIILVLGFWFGTKTQYSIDQNRMNRKG